MNTWIPSHIQITVLQAKDLLLKSKSIHSEVFVLVQVDKEKQVTHLLPRHTCPIWNQTFDIPLMSLDSSIQITVKQKNKFSEEFIGQVNIPFTQLTISKRQKRNWYKLGCKPGKTSTKLRGDILLSTSFLSKWGKDKTEPIDIETEREGGRDDRMLRRSKSEYKSATSGSNGSLSKDSPKTDKKSKGIFSRSLRKKNTQVFEDSDDFLFSTYRSSGGPPTPPQSERKQINLSMTSTQSKDDSSTTSLSSNSDLSQQHSTANATSHLLFAEATQLERNGIIDLCKADPQLRREQVKQHFREKMNNEASPKLSQHKKRPTSMYTSGQQGSKGIKGSFDSSYEEMDSTSPNRHSTYRARSIPRRQRTASINSPPQNNDNTSDNKLLTSQPSDLSIDSNTSEYYSGTSSTANTPLNSNNTLNEGMITPITGMTTPITGMTTPIDGTTTPTNNSPLNSSKSEATPPSSSNSSISSSSRRGLNLGNSSPVIKRDVKLRRGQSIDVSSSTLPRLRPQPRPHQERMSTLQRRHKAPPTLSPKETNKRHSTDVASLILKKNSLSGGKDGLENIISSGQVQRFLRKQTADKSSNHGDSPRGTPPLVRENERMFFTPPPPPFSLSADTSEATPTKTTPPKMTPSEEEPIIILDKSKSEQNDVAAILDQTTPTTVESNESSHMTNNDVITKQDDKLVGVVPTNQTNDISIAIESPISSGSTTPSRLTPPPSSTELVRETETTPSPDHEEIDGEEELVVMKDNKNKQHTVELKKSDSFHPFKPLPPSIVTPSNGIQRKYSSTTDITTLMAVCRDMISPNPNLEPLANVRSSSQCSYPYSATSSGRTSPVITEEKEGEEEERKENITPISAPPTSRHRFSPLVTSPTPLNNSSINKTSTSNTQHTTKQDTNVGNAITKTSTNSVSPSSKKGPTTATNTIANSSTGNSLVKKASTSNNTNTTRGGGGGGTVTVTKRKQGGGLKRTLSLYQENKRQVQLTKERKTVRRQATLNPQVPHNSSSSPNDENNSKLKSSLDPTQSVIPNGAPLEPTPTLGASFTAANQKYKRKNETINGDKDSPNLSSHEIQHTNNIPNSSQNNSTASSIPGTPPISAKKFTCSDFREKQDHVICSTASDVETSSVSCSSDNDVTSSEMEETNEDKLRELSKEDLISELIRTRNKLKEKNRELHDNRTYIDSLLVKVMNVNPELLLSDN